MRKKIIVSISLIFVLFSCQEKSGEVVFDGINPNVQDVYEDFERVENLSGKITDLELQSTSLNENRRITIYQPPDYDPNTSYGVLVVTDDIGAYIPYYIESLILDGEIEPIFIVGVYNRQEQPVDSLFGNYHYDFRNMEFFKQESLDGMSEQQMIDFKNGKRFSVNTKMIEEDTNVTNNPVLLEIFSNRYNRFCSFINDEVITYLHKNYAVTEDKNKWAIGGFSSGGAFIYNYSCDHPDVFGNFIVMSPAGPFDTYDFSRAKSNYLIAAGNQESFIKESLAYLETFDSLKIPYIHYTYNAGHDVQLWLTFYLESVKKIYRKK